MSVISVRNNPLPVRSSFYVTGGTLQRDAPSYVPRAADSELLEGLRDGQFCYVLTPRQMGKSSLMVRTAVRLREEGTVVAVLDLTAVGQNLTAEQWYDGLLAQLAEQLELEDELDAFWETHARLGPLQRWMQALRQVVLGSRTGKVVIFVDEIDTVRSLPFSTDEFFAAIRECYNRRAEAPEFHRLTFCLLGVAIPSDLIRDTRTTPFNIGRCIELHDFTEAEAAGLAQGLGHDEAKSAALLRRILYWTGGHPYLTQRFCRAVAEAPDLHRISGVDALAQTLFLSPRAQERDDNLLFVRERLLRSEVDLASLLELYAQVRRGKGVTDDETNPLVSLLRLSGITRVVNGDLRVRNRIYDHVFDQAWIRTNAPDAEIRRQRAAFRRGLTRAGAGLGILMAVMGWALAWEATKEARRADRQTQIARLATRRADKNAALADQNAALANQNALLAKRRASEAQQALQQVVRLATGRKNALVQMAREKDQLVASEKRERALRVQADSLRQHAVQSADRAHRAAYAELVARKEAEKVAAISKQEQVELKRLSLQLTPLSLTDFGNVAQNRGDYTLAQQYFSKALAIQHKKNPESVEVAASWSNLAENAIRRGEAQEAQDDFNHALEIEEKRVPGSPDVASTLSNLGSVALRRGDLAGAQDDYNRALNIRDRFDPQSLEVANTLVNLANVAQARDDTGLMQTYYLRAVDIRQKRAPKSIELANLLNILGQLAVARGEVSAAQDYYGRALNIRKQVAPDTLEVAANMATLGNLAYSRNDFPSAQDYYESALAIRQKKSPGSPTVAANLITLGDIYRDEGNVDAAKDRYTQALALIDTSDNKAEQTRIRQKLQALTPLSPTTPAVPDKTTPAIPRRAP